jgi:PAS domain S-box-containing protein
MPDASEDAAKPRGRGELSFDLLVDSVLDYAIFMLDPTGRVLTWNAGAKRLKGYAAEEIIGRPFTLFYPADALARDWPAEELRRAAAQGHFADEGWRLRKDGSRFWASVVITPLRGKDGTLQGYAKVTRDLTERRLQEETLRRSDEQFRLLLGSVKDYAIFMLDPEGHVLTWNSGAEAIKGYAESEVLHRHFSMFFTPQDVAAGVPARKLATALLEGRAEGEGWRVRKDGSLFWANAVLTPMRDGNGELRGFAKVTRDLTTQRRLGELEHASQRMSEFLAMLGHELRNPLAPIRNAVSIMQLQTDLPLPLRRTRDILDRQLGQLTRLVDDLLVAGRIATGKISFRRAQLDYRDVVLASVEAARPLMEARKHRLTVTLPPGPIEMTGDDTRLAQALQNLLNNAARYTPKGGEIALEVRVDELACVVSVTDNGRGIAPEALERIFQLFVQESAPGTSAEGGLGIGLALARTLVEAHGGRLTAASAGPGRGSSFSMTLPLRHEPKGDVPVRGAVAAGFAQATPRRVLVVDDNHDSADTMVAVLQLLGHDACVAHGAVEALGRAQAFRPEVVLLDLNLPDGDGYTVMRRLRAQSAEPICIAAMTGHGQESDRKRTLDAGFQAHLTKPVDVAALRRVLRSPGNEAA